MDPHKWEYLNYLGSVVRGPVEETPTPAGGVLYRTEEVDELGEQGWELIWVDTSSTRPHYYFRRPKPQERPAPDRVAPESAEALPG